MELTQWNKIIKTWVNSLNLVKHPIASISDISDGVFLINFLKKLYSGLNKYEDKNWEDSSAQNIISGYLEKEFKEYVNEGHVDLKIDEELLILASLLLFASCIKHDMSWAKSPLCHAENSMQVKIKQFMELMLNARNYTRAEIKNAIMEITDDEGPTMKTNFESPRSRFTETPKTTRTTLKEFFDSPAAQKRILSEKVNQISRLNRQILEEQNENTELQEIIQSLQKEISAQKVIIEEKSVQINTLKLELLEKSENCYQTENSACTVKEKLLKNEIKDLEVYVSHIESDMKNIKEELKSTKYKLRCAEKQNSLLKSQSAEIEKNYEGSQENIRMFTEMLTQAQKICKDQGDYIQALEKQSGTHIKNTESSVPLNFSSPENFHLSGEENLGNTVVDLVLQERENEIKILNDKVNVMETDLYNKNQQILTQQQMIEAQKLVLNELENEMAHITESCNLKQNEIEDFKIGLLAKELIINGLQNENKKLESEQNQLREDMKNKQHETDHLKTINKQFEQSVCDYIQKIRDSEEHINLLTANLRTFSQDIKKTISDTLKRSFMFLDDIDTKIYYLNEYVCKTEDVYAIKVNNISSEIDKLKMIISKSNTKLISFQKENESLEESMQSKTNDLIHLKSKLNDTELLINNLQKENRNLLLFQNKMLSDMASKDKEILELKEIKQNLDDDLRNKMEEMIILQQKLKEVQSNLSDEISNLTSQKMDLEKQLIIKREEILVLSDEMCALKSDKNSMEKCITDINNKIVVLTSKITELKLEKTVALEKMSKLEKDFTNLTEKCQRKYREINNLTEELKNKELLINNLQNENSKLLLCQSNMLSETEAKEKEILELKGSKKDFEAELYNKREEIKTLQQNLQALQKDFDSALTKISKISSESEDKMNTLTNEINLLNHHLENTIVMKDQIYSEKVNLENEISTLNSEKISLEQQLVNKEEEIIVLSNDVSAINSKKENLEKQLNDMYSKVSDLQLEKTAVLDKVNELETEKINLIEKFQRKCSEVDHLTEELNNKELLINNLQKENSNLLLCQNNMLSETEAKEKEILQLKESKRNLEDELNKKDRAINKAKDENEVVRKQISLISSEIKLLKENKTCIVNELKMKSKMLTESNQNSERLQINMDKVTLENKMLSVENAELTKKLMETAKRLTEIEFEKNTLTTMSSLSDSKINELSDLNNEYKEKIMSLETRNEKVCTDYNDMVLKLKLLQQKYDEKSIDFVAVKSKHDILQQEMTVIKNEKKILQNKKTQLSTAVAEANNMLSIHNDLKEAYTRLVEDNDRLQDEYKQLNDRMQEILKEKEQAATQSSSSLHIHQEQIRNDYEQRLQHAKNHMKAVYNEQKIKIEEQKTKELQKYIDKIQRDEDHIAELSSQLWNTNDRLLTLKQENEDLKSRNQRLRLQTCEIPERRRTLSLDQLCMPSRRKENTDILEIIDETITQTRRHSTRVVPSGMGKKLLPSGKVFPSEDEQGEVFDNTYLADLKAGRCIVDSNSDRISTLQYRNSLCPPHLKSSYPAETQFLATEKIKEDEIKGGLVTSDRENLLPAEKTRKKDKNQISYKKPGPPTPSKNGGRQLQSGTEHSQLVTPRGILRENNSENQRPRVSTPARIKALFTGRRKDDNGSTTPKTRKLLFFQRH